jgi:hypothetical protein
MITIPAAQKIQPMRFRGWCETTRAPTVGYANHSTPTSTYASGGKSRLGISGVKCWSRIVSATRATQSAHKNHAGQATARRLTLPIPRPCSLAPSVTTLLYSTTVSRALRQPLRGSLYEARSERTSENSVMKLSEKG